MIKNEADCYNILKQPLSTEDQLIDAIRFLRSAYMGS